MKIITTIFASILLMSNACSQIEKTTDRSDKSVYKIEDYIQGKSYDGLQVATVAGGCFWCTEAAFEQLVGVVDVISGYSGGEEAYPEYGQVGAGETGHAEAIYIYYDPEVVNYATLLKVFFIAHDPTTLNYQGPDYGEEYRSAIFYKTAEEKDLIDQAIKETNESGYYKDPVVTQVVEYKEFWVAEAYHQNYYELNPNQGYVARVSRPKVLKVLKTFPELIKKEYK